MRQVRRRCFLNHLLAPPLQRAVALAQRHDAALAVAEDLHFDMACIGNEAFDEHAAVLEEVLAKALHRIVGRGQFGGVIAARQTDAAAAGRALEHDGIPDALCGDFRIVQTLQQASARYQRHAGGLGDRARGVLEAKAAHLLGCGADEDDAGLRTLLGERGVFGQKAIAGNDGPGTGRPGNLQDAIATQVGLGGAAATAAVQRHRFVGNAHVQAVMVGVGIHRDRRHPHLLERARDAHRDLPTIGDEDLLEHMACSGRCSGLASDRSPLRMGR
ncbi:hypothetical protein XAUB_10330 [Xanthomonas citri pv. aurantifolii str. ICPB 11122]|nr:hypothetical protein XAUB_10330 [Xanthomonas citri pv. aurantifolii str. ICPB 11122]